jgi:hypothetical protein
MEKQYAIQELQLTKLNGEKQNILGSYIHRLTGV